MAIFWDVDDEPSPAQRNLIESALKASPPPGETMQAQVDFHAQTLAALLPGGSLKVGRLLLALGLVALLLGAGIACEAGDLNVGAKTLYGLATTAFGLVVGLLTGEKPPKGK